MVCLISWISWVVHRQTSWKSVSYSLCLGPFSPSVKNDQTLLSTDKPATDQIDDRHCISDRHKLLFDATSNPYARKQFILLHKQLYNAYLLSIDSQQPGHPSPVTQLRKERSFLAKRKILQTENNYPTTPGKHMTYLPSKEPFFFLITKEKNLYMSIRTRTAQECSANPKCRRQKRHMDCQNLNMVEK